MQPRLFVNIIGTNGSGKSTLPHALLSEARAAGETILQCNYLMFDKILSTDIPASKIAFVGKYTTACGGCDTLNKELIMAALDFLLETDYDIFFEGIMVTDTLETYWNRLVGAAENRGRDSRILFMDYPLEVCLERVRERRLAAGNTKPLNPDGITKKWYGVRKRVLIYEERIKLGAPVKLFHITEPDKAAMLNQMIEALQ